MKSNRFSRLFLLTVSGFAIVSGLAYFRSAAYAGIIGNPSNASSHVKFGSSDNFPWVGTLHSIYIDSVTKGIKESESQCTITVIDRPEKDGIWGLTSGHCVYGNETTHKRIKSYNSGYVTFGTGNKTDKDKYLLVKDIIVKREYVTSINEDKPNKPNLFLNRVPIDIALVNLVPDPTKPYPTWLSNAIKSKPRPKLPSASLVGGIHTGSFVGTGVQGNGKDKEKDYRIYSPAYLGGQNYVQVLKNFLSYDLDYKDGTKPKTNFDGKPALDLEYNPASGDSGGPIFINNILAGVHSRSQGGKYVCVKVDPKTGKPIIDPKTGEPELTTCQFERGLYGTIGYALRTDQYISWINKVITGYKPGNAVSLKIAKGGKLILRPVDKSPGPRAEADTISIEIPAGSTFYIFTPSEDKPDTPS